MITMILGILKWIGILLLGILGLILAILLILLLVPVRYRVQGTRSPEGGLMTARGKVSWLLSILAVTFSYEQEFSWKVRIFGIPLGLGQKSEEEDVEDLTEEQLAQIAELEAELEADSKKGSNADHESGLMRDLQKKTDVKQKTEPKLSLQTQEVDADRECQEPPSAEERKKVPWKEKVRGIGHKISDTLHAIPDKITGIKEKIRSLKEKVDSWHAFLKSDEVQQFLVVCKKQIRQILRHLIPTKFRIQGNYGFEDPSLTGKITGFIYALPPRYQKCFQVHPHFQEECLDGEVFLRGRIRLGSLVWPLIKILVKPCTWKVYKKYKVITKPQSTSNGTTASAKAKTTGKATKKKSGKAGDSHKMNTKNKKSDPHKGGK